MNQYFTVIRKWTNLILLVLVALILLLAFVWGAFALVREDSYWAYDTADEAKAHALKATHELSSKEQHDAIDFLNTHKTNRFEIELEKLKSQKIALTRQISEERARIANLARTEVRENRTVQLRDILFQYVEDKPKTQSNEMPKRTCSQTHPKSEHSDCLRKLVDDPDGSES